MNSNSMQGPTVSPSQPDQNTTLGRESNDGLRCGSISNNQHMSNSGINAPATRKAAVGDASASASASATDTASVAQPDQTDTAANDHFLNVLFRVCPPDAAARVLEALPPGLQQRAQVNTTTTGELGYTATVAYAGNLSPAWTPILGMGPTLPHGINIIGTNCDFRSSQGQNMFQIQAPSQVQPWNFERMIYGDQQYAQGVLDGAELDKL
jgi:hypothetical protein